MLGNRCRNRKCCRGTNKLFGIILVSIGTGLFLAYIIPYYMLITLLGLALVFTGVCNLIKK